MMHRTVVYIHGKGGAAQEAEHYKPLFPECGVVGFDYKAATPWEAKEEFSVYFDRLYAQNGDVILIANSIGAYFSMCALGDRPIKKALFISPVVDMEALIGNMMAQSHITEDELREKGEVITDTGETVSWEYLQYVRENPIDWRIPTSILSAENDCVTSLDSMRAFSARIGADLTVMKNGEHWFHTKEQMAYLDAWIVTALS